MNIPLNGLKVLKQKLAKIKKMIDFSNLTNGTDISQQLKGLKDMIPTFASIMQTYKKEGETEIIAIGTFEADENGKICPFIRLASYTKEVHIVEGKEVNKMVISRIVKGEDNKPMQWNLFDFLNYLPDETKQNTIED